MKNILAFFLLLFNFFSVNAQYAIGKLSVDGSALLDFSMNSKGGIVLPRVTQMPSTTASTQNGTLLVNAINLNSIRVQMRQNDTWIDLTDPVDLPNIDVNTVNDSKFGFVLGDKVSKAEGALVLESSTRALVLPKVNDVTKITNVIIGTVFYDMSTKSLAVFDGRVWVYWK